MPDMIKRIRKEPKFLARPGSIGARVMALVDLDERSETEISEAALLGKSYIRDLRRFPDRAPNTDKLRQLAAELGTTAEWLAFNAGDPPQALIDAAQKHGEKPALSPYIEQNVIGRAAGEAQAKPSNPIQAHSASPNSPGVSQGGEVVPAPWKGIDVVTLRKDLPVLGTAAGSLNTAFILKNEAAEFVRRPPALDGVAGAYAVRVVGKSMIPLHRPRDLCLVNPNLPYAPDDSVVIQTQLHEGGGIVAYIKTFVSENDDEIVVTQIHPVATIQFKRAQVVSVHKVLTMNDILSQ